MALPNPVVDDPAVAGPALPAVNGAAVPVTFYFEPFNPASSKFDRWLNRLQISFRIYHVREADKRDFLLHYMGDPTYDVLCNKLKNAEPHTKTYDEIVALLKEHYSPTPLEILENFKFASRKQLEQETLSDYLMHLEKLAQTCNFGDYMDKALRNQFVFGIQNRVIQSRLLEVRDLTLTKAKEIAFGMEMSHRGTDEMHNSREMHKKVRFSTSSMEQTKLKKASSHRAKAVPVKVPVACRTSRMVEINDVIVAGILTTTQTNANIKLRSANTARKRGTLRGCVSPRPTRRGRMTHITWRSSRVL
ncbi:uncharacterized protein LOC121590579 isoform X2 [Anopheles merus]|uniref:uncharacterized protein LOC121590579 isoform X2 n=1 Tax=Anopheles merus TaxID=30066 RepID=UPI001BE449C5|nr:uncharacterized protein LOC121590579 isoform X2 [Anopheles merus]